MVQTFHEDVKGGMVIIRGMVYAQMVYGRMVLFYGGMAFLRIPSQLDTVNKRYGEVNAIIIPLRKMWLFVETQQEMWLLASDWLAIPALQHVHFQNFFGVACPPTSLKPSLFLNQFQISSAEKKIRLKTVCKLCPPF